MASRMPDVREMAMAIAENSVQGIVVMDEDGSCLYANRAWAEITGFSAADMGAIPVHDWVHHHRPDGSPLPLHECPIGCTLGRDEDVRKHRDVFFRKDGRPFDVSCAASTLHAGGRVLKILEIRDTTEETNAARSKDEFLAMLAHELRNPLAPIVAAAGLLRLGRLDADGVRRTSEVIARQAGHMTGLVDDLLDVSRVTRGQISLEKEALDLRTVVAEAIEQAQPAIDARGHHLRFDAGSAPAMVSGDRKRLVQAVANLLNNAAKYTPDGGAIAVELAADGAGVRLQVSDDGIGMTPEMCERAFELFSQAERSPDRAQGGLGIGLALVRSLVVLHGGQVSAHSAGPGQGTRVVLRLPAYAAGAAVPASHTPSELAPSSAPARDGSLRIMVVDDSPDAADMLGMLLEARGHAVTIAHRPEQALALAAAGPYHAFLLDIGLPGMDGMQLARAVRAQPHNAGALLVAVTGYGQEQDRDGSRAAGFDHHLLKPTEMAALDALLGPLSRPAPG